MTGPARPTTRRTVLRAALGAAGTGLLAGSAAADARHADSGPKGDLRIATGEPDGFYAAFGRLLAAQVTAAYPRLSCEVVNSEGSVANVRLLQARRADVAPALSDLAWAAYGGTAPFDRRVPLRAIGRVYENYFQLAVRSEAPIHTVADLAGRTVSLGAPASGGAVLGDRLLRVAGLTPGTDVRVRHLLMPQAARAMRAGAIDALLVAGGVPLPVLSGLDTRPGIRLLPLSGLLPRLRAGLGPAGSGLEAVTVPAGAYGRNPEVPTIGVANLLLCRPGLPVPVASALTHVLVRRAGRLVPAPALGTQFLDRPQPDLHGRRPPASGGGRRLSRTARLTTRLRRSSSRRLVPRQATFAPSRRPVRPLAAPAESQVHPARGLPAGTPPSSSSRGYPQSTHRTPLLDGQTLPAGALGSRPWP